MKITMVSKIRLDGTPCPKCEDVKQRLTELGGELDLPEKPLGAEALGQLGLEDLHGDFSAVPRIVREVHGGHAAGAQLALDHVAVSQGPLEALELRGHRSGAVNRVSRA